MGRWAQRRLRGGSAPVPAGVIWVIAVYRPTRDTLLLVFSGTINVSDSNPLTGWNFDGTQVDQITKVADNVIEGSWPNTSWGSPTFVIDSPPPGLAGALPITGIAGVAPDIPAP